MPDRRAMNVTAETLWSARGAWKYHRARCEQCRACTCEPPNPAELCDDGAALREAITERRAAFDAAVAKPTGWRY